MNLSPMRQLGGKELADHRRLTLATNIDGGLPRGVTGIAGRLLFSLKQRITFCLFGSVSGRLLGRRAFGIGCCLRCKLGLLRSVALLA